MKRITFPSSTRASMRSLRRLKRELEGYLFILPWLVGFIVLTAGPVFASFGLSLFEWRLIEPPRYIGLQNYAIMFGQDPLFWQSLKVTLTYVAVAVPLQIIFALFLAVLLKQPVRLVGVFRTIYYLPAVVSGVAISILWLWLYEPNFGLLNDLLLRVGIHGPNWLGLPAWALPALIFMSLWGVGSTMIVFLAGLQNVPRHLLEAADLDGAGACRRFTAVTLPMISPVLFFNLIMGIISGFQTFTQAYVMTQGRPLNSTLFYALYLYQNAFEFLKMGYASSMAWVMFLIILALTMFQFRLAGRWVYYEGEAK